MSKFQLDANLPYLILSFQNNSNLKFLVDTGAQGSFITPKFVPDIAKIALEKPISINTVLQEHPISQMAILPIFEQEREFPFLMFDFHQFFDGLIGLNILTQLPAIIDIAQLTFTLPNTILPLREIKKESKSLIKVPVSVKEGPFLCEHIRLGDDFFITTIFFRYNCIDYAEDLQT